MISSWQARGGAKTVVTASVLLMSACSEDNVPQPVRSTCPSGTVREGAQCVTDPATIRGCTDESAANYNPRAALDDGSCSNMGCTDMVASNYNPRATEDDGSCFREGCTTESASNYEPAATLDDGSCAWPVTFRVDMSAVGAFSEGSPVFLRGDFNAFCADCAPMTDEDGDDIYELQVELSTGVYDYVFAYGPAPGTEEALPEDCETRTRAGHRRVEVAMTSQALEALPFGRCEELGLPFTVSDAYATSGFMGEGENGALGAQLGCPERAPDAVGSCFTFSYTPAGAPGWAGVFWQNPDGNWGQQPGFAMPPGATKVRFYAWTAGGGERLSFGAGMGGVDPFNVEITDVVMSTTPTAYEINLGNVSYETIVGAFVWTAAAPAAPMTLYVDSVVWDDAEVGPGAGCTNAEATNYDPGATTDDGSCIFPVTFQVDMGCTEASFSTVWVTGPFCEWCSSGFPLLDEDGDDVYTGTFEFPEGPLEFKYMVDEFAGQEDLLDDVMAGGSCAPINGTDFANRQITVDGAVVTNDSYGSCESCGGGGGGGTGAMGCTRSTANNFDPMADTDDGSCLFDVTFEVDMACAGQSFSTVWVTGPFCSWCGDGFELVDADADGVYTGTYEFEQGPLEYKYMVDGFAQQEDLVDDMLDGAMCAPVTDYSSYANRQLTVDDRVTRSETYGSCEPCP